ncbi:uncharacterized protein NPIL_16961 [Nephila pilipes]|uniref:Uncharacterized protein n=1 Tax=Nephila pilipes TaxID=299642 RepID=A0A8X6TKW6_NEPPI|nr:uncharacterized protein NPIL_16961 [Nephila pilipes]
MFQELLFKLSPTYYEIENTECAEKNYLNFLLQESMDRCRGEYASLQMNPKTQLSKALDLFNQCRTKDVTIVFGNLGRHPLILTYFLDYCFTAQESVGIVAHWSTHSPYQVKPPISSLDFLFFVEPYFGFGVQKPDNVKHLIVLTSHLSLSLPAFSVQLKRLHVGAPVPDICPVSSSDPGSLLQPLGARRLRGWLCLRAFSTVRSACAAQPAMRLLACVSEETGICSRNAATQCRRKAVRP